MSSPQIRRSGRTPVKRFKNEFLFDELSDNDDDNQQAHLSSDDEWDPTKFEEQPILPLPHDGFDEEFEGTVDVDPLAFDKGDSSKCGWLNSSVRINLSVVKEEFEEPTAGEGTETRKNVRNDTEEQRKRKAELQRLRRRNMTNEQRKKITEQSRLRRRQRQTEEGRQKRAEQIRIRRQRRTAEQRERDLEKQRLRRKEVSNEMKKTQTELQEKLKAQLTDAEREETITKLQQIEHMVFQKSMDQYLRRQARFASMTEEEKRKARRNETIQKHLEKMKETPEERQERLKKSRERSRNQRLNWTPEQHEHHRQWCRNWQKMNAQALHYSQMPIERKERIRAYQRERLKKETPEHREKRLARYKRNMEKRRLLLKMQEEGISKDDAENELRSSRPDLYPVSDWKSKVGPKPYKPYEPRDPNTKRKPPPGRKSTVTPEELKEFLKDMKRRGLDHPCKEILAVAETGDSMANTASSKESNAQTVNGTIVTPLSTSAEQQSFPSSSKCNISAKPISNEELVNVSTKPQVITSTTTLGEDGDALCNSIYISPAVNSAVKHSFSSDKPECQSSSNISPAKIKDANDYKEELNETVESTEDFISSPPGSTFQSADDIDCESENDVVNHLDSNSTCKIEVEYDSDSNSNMEKITDKDCFQKEVTQLHCDKCGKVYTTKKLFERHMEAHENENSKTFKCPHPLCDKKFSHSAYVLRHFVKKHAGNAEKPSSLEIEENVATSQRLMVAANISVCPYCGKTFDKLSSCARHVQSIHEYNPEEEAGFICQHCSKIFKVKCTLDDHIRRVHLGMENKCDVCGRSFQSPMKLWKHKVDAHDMTDLDPSSVSKKVRTFQCEYCGIKMFRGMKAHVEKEHPERLEEYLRGQNSVNRREEKRRYWHTIGKFKKKEQARKMYERQPSTCSTCNKVFTRHDSLRSHMAKIHPTGNTVVSCDKCEKVCATELVFVNHILCKHPGLAKIKIYGVFVDAGEQEEGKGGKRLICQFCRAPQDDNFMYRLHLHEKHTQEIIKRFKEGVVEDQNKPVIPCPHCDVIIRTNETGLSIHIRMKHPDQAPTKVKSRHRKRTTPESEKKKSRKKAISTTVFNSSGKRDTSNDEDDDDDSFSEDGNEPAVSTIMATRKSARVRGLPRRYLADDDEEEEEEGRSDLKIRRATINHGRRHKNPTKLKKVKVPSFPMEFSQEEKERLEKCQGAKWKGNLVVVLKRLNHGKTKK